MIEPRTDLSGPKLIPLLFTANKENSPMVYPRTKNKSG
jgi:hypothetical protein